MPTPLRLNVGAEVADHDTVCKMASTLTTVLYETAHIISLWDNGRNGHKAIRVSLQGSDSDSLGTPDAALGYTVESEICCQLRI